MVKIMHDLFCKEYCKCGKECYADPNLRKEEHLCFGCIEKHPDWKLIDGWWDNIKSDFSLFPVICKYFYLKVKGEFD